MQQYFICESLTLNMQYPLPKDIYHHQKHVLRSKDGDLFRVVDIDRQLYLCELSKESFKVLKKIDEQRELNIDVTIIMSLIKNEKFDFCLQKLTELGVKRIVPFLAKRSIIKIKDKESKIERYKKIVQEASEQSLRTIVPDIPDIIQIKDLKPYLSEFNYVAYEKNDDTHIDYSKLKTSVTIIIGPEGGFEDCEITTFKELGIIPVSLGKRILRAETAALYCMANIAGVNEK